MNNEVTVSTKSLEDKIVVLAKNFRENAIDLAKHCYEYYSLMSEDKPQATRDLMRLTKLNKASVSQLKKAGEYYYKNPNSIIETSKAYLLADLNEKEQNLLENKSVEAIREFKRSKKKKLKKKLKKEDEKEVKKEFLFTNEDIADLIEMATKRHRDHIEYSKSKALDILFDRVTENMIDSLNVNECKNILKAIRYIHVDSNKIGGDEVEKNS